MIVSVNNHFWTCKNFSTCISVWVNNCDLIFLLYVLYINNCVCLAPVTSRVHVMRENCTASKVQDLPTPPLVENIRNKKCQVSLGVPGHVASQIISSFFIPLKVSFPDNSSRSIQTETVPCDMPAIVLLAPEEQQQEQEPSVQPVVEPSPPSARPKKMEQQGRFQCLYPGCTKSFTRKHDLTRHDG